MSIDTHTFSAVYDEYAPRIFTYCYFRVNSKEDAEDLAAQVFVRTWNYIAQGNQIDNVKAFLYRTASNLVVDFYRTSKKKKEISLDNPSVTVDIPEDASFVEALDHQFALREVRKFLTKLPEQFRDVVILRYIEDLTVAEIAHVTGITENNVSVRLHRAIDKIKELTGSKEV